jgi:hypothetical protein
MSAFQLFELGLGPTFFETTLVFPIQVPDKILKFSITREYSSFEHQFPGKQDLPRENGLWIRTQHGQITLESLGIVCFL